MLKNPFRTLVIAGVLNALLDVPSVFTATLIGARILYSLAVILSLLAAYGGYKKKIWGFYFFQTILCSSLIFLTVVGLLAGRIEQYLISIIVISGGVIFTFLLMQKAKKLSPKKS